MKRFHFVEKKPRRHFLRPFNLLFTSSKISAKRVEEKVSSVIVLKVFSLVFVCLFVCFGERLLKGLVCDQFRNSIHWIFVILYDTGKIFMLIGEQSQIVWYSCLFHLALLFGCGCCCCCCCVNSTQNKSLYTCSFHLLQNCLLRLGLSFPTECVICKNFVSECCSDFFLCHFLSLSLFKST